MVPAFTKTQSKNRLQWRCDFVQRINRATCAMDFIDKQIPPGVWHPKFPRVLPEKGKRK